MSPHRSNQRVSHQSGSSSHTSIATQQAAAAAEAAAAAAAAATMALLIHWRSFSVCCSCVMSVGWCGNLCCWGACCWCRCCHGITRCVDMEYTYKCMRAVLQHPTKNSTQGQTKLHRARLQVVDSVPPRVCVGGQGAGGGTCLCERGGGACTGARSHMAAGG